MEALGIKRWKWSIENHLMTSAHEIHRKVGSDSSEMTCEKSTSKYVPVLLSEFTPDIFSQTKCLQNLGLHR